MTKYRILVKPIMCFTSSKHSSFLGYSVRVLTRNNFSIIECPIYLYKKNAVRSANRLSGIFKDSSIKVI